MNILKALLLILWEKKPARGDKEYGLWFTYFEMIPFLVSICDKYNLQALVYIHWDDPYVVFMFNLPPIHEYTTFIPV